MKLNLGCGTNKIDGFINIDCDAKCEPDVVLNFTGKLPYKDGEVEEIVAYHVFEHIPKAGHRFTFDEIYRVLRQDGQFTMSFPEFPIIVKYYLENYKGEKEFWEATIYGRQSSPSDYHVCAMERKLVARQLINNGFEITYCGPEPDQDFNSVIRAVKRKKFTYQEAMNDALAIS